MRLPLLVIPYKAQRAPFPVIHILCGPWSALKVRLEDSTRLATWGDTRPFDREEYEFASDDTRCDLYTLNVEGQMVLWQHKQPITNLCIGEHR